MPSFSNPKRLRFVITLGTATFDLEGSKRITIEGLRARVEIDKAGGMMMGTLRAQIYGVSQSDMNTITTFTRQAPTNGTFLYKPNTVEVWAIDGKAETQIFAGNMVNSWGDYTAMPDVFLHIQAQAAYYASIKPIPPRSFKGQVDVASVMAQIAKDLGYTFENNGVNVQLTDIYLANSGLEQARELARMASIGFAIDDKVLAITPSFITPRKAKIPYLSAETGMRGYPVFDGVGVTVEALFNPGIVFLGLMEVKSDVVRANGKWIVTSIAHHLESERPGGAWFSTIRGNSSGFAIAK